MSEAYPFPCNRCGFCCIAKQCQVSVQVFGQLPNGIVCPALSFDGDVSSCGLIAMAKPEFKDEAMKVLGIGAGCCVKARVMTVGGQQLDFAAMPDDQKVGAVRQIRAGIIQTISGKDYDANNPA
jgi:hypothetical protein